MLLRDDTFVGHEGFSRKLQWNTYSCALRSVQAILEYLGIRTSYRQLGAELNTDTDGTDMRAVTAALRKRGLRARTRHQMRINDLRYELSRGSFLIAYLDGDHVGVVYGYGQNTVYLADPSLYRAVFQRVSVRDFIRRWDKSALVVRA